MAEKQPNPLNVYASYNNIFTFACLTKGEVNAPGSYRSSGPSQVIIKSGGTGGTNKVTTADEDAMGIRAEYFIDDVVIESLITPTQGTRTTNATRIQFKVTEPYSMGLFLQACKVAAIQNGYANYMQAGFLLMVEFVGWGDDGNFIASGENTRYYPLKLTNVTFTVTGNGTEYDVEAIPWNEQALIDQNETVMTDIAIQGKNVVELLQSGEKSLTTIMNGRFEELKQEQKLKESSEIVITFPQQFESGVEGSGLPESPNETTNTSTTTNSGSSGGRSRGNSLIGGIVQGFIGGVATGILQQAAQGVASALQGDSINRIYQEITGFLGAQAPQDFEAFLSSITGLIMQKSDIGGGLSQTQQSNSSVNDIGNAAIIASHNDPGQVPMGESGRQWDQNNKVYTRAKNTVSDDERTFSFPAGTKITRIIEEVVITSDYGKELIDRAVDANGMVDWFKVETEVYFKPNTSQELLDGEDAKVFVYRVLPYKVHHSILVKPTDAGQAYQNLRDNAVKEYNYIYTGENLDIIDFNIEINAGFFTLTSADYGQNNTERQTGYAVGKTVEEDERVLTITDPVANVSPTGQVLQTNVLTLSTLGGGGAGIDTDKVRTARQFHESVLQGGVDLVNLELTIHGDPYFIADSGIGNYSAAPSGLNITSDGTVNYQSSEVDIIVNFRTPVDYGDGNGVMQLVPQYSGLYRVVQVNNNWQDNKFSQTLKLLRRRMQEDLEDVSGGEDVKNEDAPREERSNTPREPGTSPCGGPGGGGIGAPFEITFGPTPTSATTGSTAPSGGGAPTSSPRPQPRPTVAAPQRSFGTFNSDGTVAGPGQAARPGPRPAPTARPSRTPPQPRPGQTSGPF